MRGTGYEVRDAGYGMRVTGCGLRDEAAGAPLNPKSEVRNPKQCESTKLERGNSKRGARCGIRESESHKVEESKGPKGELRTKNQGRRIKDCVAFPVAGVRVASPVPLAPRASSFVECAVTEVKLVSVVSDLV